MPLPQPPAPRARHTVRNKEDAELLFKGVTCALIGAVILLAPHLARAASVQDLMRQASLVGWFSLVLGLAFIVRYGMRRRAAKKVIR